MDAAGPVVELYTQRYFQAKEFTDLRILWAIHDSMGLKPVLNVEIARVFPGVIAPFESADTAAWL